MSQRTMPCEVCSFQVPQQSGNSCIQKNYKSPTIPKTVATSRRSIGAETCDEDRSAGVGAVEGAVVDELVFAVPVVATDAEGAAVGAVDVPSLDGVLVVVVSSLFVGT